MQCRLVFGPLVTVNTVATPPTGGAPAPRMSIGVSPRLLPTSFSSLVGLMMPILASVGPALGASLFTYLATSALFAFQPSDPLLTPAGSTNAPAALPPT